MLLSRFKNSPASAPAKPWLRRGLAVTAIAGMLALAGCADRGASGGGGGEAAAGSMADMEKVTLKFNITSAQAGPGGNIVQDTIDYIEEESGGKIEFDTYWSAALLPANEALEGVSSGVADLAQLSPSFFPQDLPVSNWLTGLGSYPDKSMLHGFMAENGAIAELFVNNQDIVDEYAKHDAKVLQAKTTPAADMVCTEPIESLDDAKGKRVRVSGELWQGEASAIGMVGSFQTLGEVYESL